MYLKPQDVVIMTKLCLAGVGAWSYNQLAYELRLSPSEVHKGLKRAAHARLYDEENRQPRRKALIEFFLHGVKYAYAPDIGGMTRGMPTSFATPGLREHFVIGDEIFVWPDPQGEERGLSFEPLYKTVPQAARKDRRLYSALGMLDSIRYGRARERVMAERLLVEVLAGNA